MTPYYQQQLQKIASDPDRHNFVSSMLTNKIFQDMAGQRAINTIRQMQMEARKTGQDRTYGLAKERDTIRRDLRGAEQDFLEKDMQTAGLVGLGGLAGGTAVGVLDLKQKLRDAERTNRFTKRLYGK